MKIKNQRDFWAGMMFLVVGLAFAWGSTSYSFGDSARPGPGYFPFGLGLLLSILGGIEVFKALAFETEGDNRIGAAAWKPLATIILAVVVFGATLPLLGLFIALPLLIIISAFAGDEFRWKETLLSCVVLTAGSWAVFIWGLNLIIPLTPSFMG